MPFIGSQSSYLALHDSNEISLNHGFIPDADGSFSGRLRHDEADRTFNVKGGAYYPLDIKLAKLTGASGTGNITVIFARESRQLRFT